MLSQLDRKTQEGEFRLLRRRRARSLLEFVKGFMPIKRITLANDCCWREVRVNVVVPTIVMSCVHITVCRGQPGSLSRHVREEGNVKLLATQKGRRDLQGLCGR